MLDLKFIRENISLANQSLKNRNLKLNVNSLVSKDEERRKILSALEDLRSKRNKANDQISSLLKAKKDAGENIASMKSISEEIGLMEKKVKELEAEILKDLISIPNLPHSSVPVGNQEANQVVRSWGKPREFDFKPSSHVDIAQKLDIIDFSRATKITGSNFVLYKGPGAALERALINFMLDLHTRKHGYTEIFPPFLVNRASMTGTGQLPKMEEDMYRLKDDDLFLIPTAEVPVTNIFRDEILDEKNLPISYVAYSACFRREAGAYGKDTRGLMRVHEFNKVEMVKFTNPEDSYAQLEKLVNDAEDVLRLLELPYRVVMLATEDLSFAASKCYDLEAYSPGIGKWLEVSSCSNFESFQARRANIRFRPKDKQSGKQATEYLHTLNGSGVAIPRTMAAIIENYQQADGSIIIPEVLRGYMDGKERISE